jgi:twitching motility protein PilJ
MAFLFYQTLERNAKLEIQQSLSIKTQTVENDLATATEATKSLSAAVQHLHASGVREPEAYKQLTFEFFRKRPELAMSTSFGQKANAIVPSLKWFWPYFYVDQGSPDQIGQSLPAPDNKTIYSELFKDDNYPERDYYKTTVDVGDVVWMEPFQWYGIPITSLMTPIRDRSGKILGVSNADVNVKAIAETVKDTVYQKQGYFVILSTQGNLLAYSQDPQKAIELASYQKIPELQRIWDKIQQNKTGIFQAGGQIWAYERIPSNNWLLLAVVPESAVYGPALTITVLGTAGVGLLLALATWLFVQQLNHRLQPILDECNKLAQADEQTQAKLQKQDEIGQLSTSFFNLLARLSANQEQIRQEANMRAQLQEEQRQTVEAEAQVLQEDVGQLLDTVLAVEDGDLTIQAPVSDRVTGLVSDSFNRLVEQLARIMATVSSTTQQVTQNALNVEQLAIQTAQQVQQQTQSVDAVQALMQNINDLTQNNVRQTQTANESVQQAQESVLRGQQQMTQLNQDVDTLGQGADLINKRVQTLNDFVQLAVQFAKDQRRISSMTRVLSLNASLLSTRATEQQDPEQFASIAREFETIATQVNDLAVQTSQSLIVLQQRTDQIQTVVSGLNQDSQEINQIIKDFTTGVAQSRQVFDEIKMATGQVAQIEEQVTQSSMAIAQTVDTTLKSIQEIATLASDTEKQANVTREQSVAMEKVAGDLYEMVRFFRIAPEQIQTDSTLNSLQPVSTNGKHNYEEQPNSTNRKVVQ